LVFPRFLKILLPDFYKFRNLKELCIEKSICVYSISGDLGRSGVEGDREERIGDRETVRPLYTHLISKRDRCRNADLLLLSSKKGSSLIKDYLNFIILWRYNYMVLNQGGTHTMQS